MTLLCSSWHIPTLDLSCKRGAATQALFLSSEDNPKRRNLQNSNLPESNRRNRQNKLGKERTFQFNPFSPASLPIKSAQNQIRTDCALQTRLQCVVAQLHTPKYHKPTIFSFSKVPGLDPSTKVPNPRSSHDSALAGARYLKDLESTNG